LDTKLNVRGWDDEWDDHELPFEEPEGDMSVSWGRETTRAEDETADPAPFFSLSLARRSLFVTWDKYTHLPSPPTYYRISTPHLPTSTPSSTISISTTASTASSTCAIAHQPISSLARPFNPLASQDDQDAKGTRLRGHQAEISLRGCIGTFSGGRLGRMLREYAIIA
jgi:hypothetical protein